mmetsp:Transcript_6025/g.16044  ORF Transcript_6025/g.16044 Transcript_6025/m.16044 type:complete len:221 (+) Transcript_6025:114-776(+)
MPPAEHMGRQSGWTQAPLVANTARRDALGLLPTFSAPELSETGSQGEGPAPSKKSNPPGSPRCAQNCDVRCPRDPALDTRPASGRKMARQREGQTVEGHAATCAYPPTPVTPCDVHPACSTPEEPAERELRDDIYVQRPQRASAAQPRRAVPAGAVVGSAWTARPASVLPGSLDATSSRPEPPSHAAEFCSRLSTIGERRFQKRMPCGQCASPRPSYIAT